MQTSDFLMTRLKSNCVNSLEAVVTCISNSTHKIPDWSDPLISNVVLKKFFLIMNLNLINFAYVNVLQLCMSLRN